MNSGRKQTILKRKKIRIWKTSEKKNETRMQNKMEGQFSRIEQAEDRISELEYEMVIKRKTEELLVKQLKTCEKKMQGYWDSKMATRRRKQKVRFLK
jgi:hypothetical protein